MKLTEKKPFSYLSFILLSVFVIVFLLMYIQIAFDNIYTLNVVFQATAPIVYSVFCAFIGLIGYKNREQVVKHRYLFLIIALVVIFLVQLYVGFVTKQTASHDYGKVLNGAMVYAENPLSEEFEGYEWYYHHYQNNSGLFLIFQLFFRILRFFGITAYYEAAIINGHLIFSSIILFTFLYLEKAFGSKSALVSLLLFLSYLPVYFQSSVAYTDTYSAGVIPLALYLFEIGKTQSRSVKRIVTYLGAGVVLAIGAKIKATVLILLVAVVLEMLLTMKFSEVVKRLAVVAVALVITTFGFKQYAYHIVIDKEREVSEGMPVTHWLMMGLKGNGEYNSEDEWEITCSVGGVSERTKLNLEEIKLRLFMMGPRGYRMLLHRKTCFTFGIGDYNIDYLLCMEPENPEHPIYEIVRENGSLHTAYIYASQTVYLSFYLLGIVGALCALIKRKAGIINHFAPYLSLVGFYIFMLLWESGRRQPINQLGLYISVAAVGLVCIVDGANSLFKPKEVSASVSTAEAQ